jgi:hypothetical protein
VFYHDGIKYKSTARETAENIETHEETIREIKKNSKKQMKMKIQHTRTYRIQ